LEATGLFWFLRGLPGSAEKFPNLTVKKIPKQVLSRCEWGHDDYSLKVENLPKAPKLEKAQTNMFDEGDE